MSDHRALIASLRACRLNTLRRTSMSVSGDVPDLYPPVPEHVLVAEELRLGFMLPPFLRALYLDVGNGGFGPGYGLWGLTGGYAPYDLSIIDSYLESALFAAEGSSPSPGRMITICDWGCSNWSFLDCATDDGEMVFARDDGAQLREGITLEQWMEDWVADIDLWSRAYGLATRTARTSPHLDV